MKYLQWLCKFSRFSLYYGAYGLAFSFGWLADKLHDKNVTWKSLKNEFKGFWDGDNNSR